MMRSGEHAIWDAHMARIEHEAISLHAASLILRVFVNSCTEAMAQVAAAAREISDRYSTPWAKVLGLAKVDDR